MHYLGGVLTGKVIYLLFDARKVDVLDRAHGPQNIALIGARDSPRRRHIRTLVLSSQYITSSKNILRA